MDNIALYHFGIFLSALIILDISLIISLLRTGDERKTAHRLENQRLYTSGGYGNFNHRCDTVAYQCGSHADQSLLSNSASLP